MQNDDELPAQVIDNTDEFTEEDDEPEEEIYKRTATDFIVQYLLQDEKFAEWIFNRNRWDEVEQKYDIERKKLLQPAHRQPITVDLAAMRKVPKETGQRLFPALLQVVRDNPGITAAEINSKLNRTNQQASAVFKCLERNEEKFIRMPERGVGGVRYRFYVKEEMITE